MNLNERFHGQTNAVIMFVLYSGDRHTDELKEIIDSKFLEVKIGTLYSIITRLKSQGLISEYRASSQDSSRRKYYKLTEQGKTVFENDFSALFDGIEPIPVKQVEVPKTSVNKENPKPAEQEEDVFLKYVKKAEDLTKYQDIDFSNVVINQPEVKTVEEIKPNYEQIFIPDLDDEFSKPEKEVNLDSIVGSKYDYNSVLSQLFPKSNVENSYSEAPSFEYDYQEPTPSVDGAVLTETLHTEDKSTKNVTDINALFDIAERENIKIRTSVDTNRYQGNKILVNKLRFHSAFLIAIIAVLEYLLLTFIFSNTVEFNLNTLIVIASVFGAFALINLIIYVLKYNHEVKDLPKFINSMEIAIILTFATLIICFCVASINGIHFNNVPEVFSSIILPGVMALNAPIYVALEHALSKLDFYQSI